MALSSTRSAIGLVVKRISDSERLCSGLALLVLRAGEVVRRGLGGIVRKELLFRLPDLSNIERKQSASFLGPILEYS